jgi:hypothetical protein
LAQNDPGLGYTSNHDFFEETVALTYSQTIEGFGPATLDQYINHDTEFYCEIDAVDCYYLLPDGSPIRTAAGRTFYNDSFIWTVYDYTECCSRRYLVAGQSNPWVEFPSFVLLFHEISHAVIQMYYPMNNAEENIILFENNFRQELGLPLREEQSHAGTCGHRLSGFLIPRRPSAGFSRRG